MGLWFPDIQNQVSFKNSTVDQTVCEILEEKARLVTFDTSAMVNFSGKTVEI